MKIMLLLKFDSVSQIFLDVSINFNPNSFFNSFIFSNRSILNYGLGPKANAENV